MKTKLVDKKKKKTVKCVADTLMIEVVVLFVSSFGYETVIGISFNIRKEHVVENLIMPLSLFNAKVSNFGVNLVFFLTYVENLLMPLSLFNANISNLGVNLVLFLKFLI